MSSTQPIGIFDSGVGGLSVALAISEQLPSERLIYYADSGRAPWGVRPPEQIREFSHAAVRFLVELGAKMIVVACNTSTVHAIRYLREGWPGIPFVGTVPAVKPAARATRSGKIGVLATAATAHGVALADLIDQFVEPQGVAVSVVAPRGLVEQVERGELESPATIAILRESLVPMLAAGVDTLVHGCTHFPFLRQQIAAVTGGRMQQIESGPAIARQSGRVLAERGLLNPGPHHYALAEISLYTSGDPAQVAATVAKLLGEPIPVLHHDALAAMVR